MSGLAHVCALLLAAVFVWAAAAKLAHPDRTAAGFRAMGVTGAATMAVVVPVVELLLAVALAAAPRAGGLASLGVLAAFSAFLAHALRAGVTARCACFGATAARPLSRTDLARNGVLAALAATAVLS